MRDDLSPLSAALAVLLALPAGWGLGLGVARLIDPQASMLPVLTILPVTGLLALVAILPWARAAVRLRLMQVLAGLGLVLMLLMA